MRICPVGWLGRVARLMAVPHDAVLVLRDVSFVRGGKPILSDITWAIEPGQHWALLGANGSGKTTLLKIVTGYEWASRGSVYVLGRHFGECDLRALRKAIGWVSASIDAQFPTADTALEIVLAGIDAALGIYRHYTPSETERARAALDAVGASGLAGQAFGTLSQGERQRVDIARALAVRPALLVLDEPCAGLDPVAREHFLKDLERLRGGTQAPATVLVTHHLEEIGPSISHVCVLKGGTIVESGPKALTLRDDVLSHAFDHPCMISRNGGRYRLQLM